MSDQNHEMLFPLFERINECLDRLSSGLFTLARALEEDPHFVVHDLALIPYRMTGQDTLPEVVIPQSVPLGDRSPQYVAELITAIRYREDQHAKSTLRASGLIGVSPSTFDQIQEVNRLKSDFKDAVKTVPTRQRRMLNRHFPGLSRLQAYRELVALNGQPDGVHFFWASNKTGSSRKTVEQLREELKNEKDAVPSTDSTMINAIQFDLDQLAHLPDNEYLSKRRAIRVHPQGNIWVDGRIARQEDAYLPIFYVVDPSKPEPEVTSMPNSDESGARIRSARSDRKVEDQPLLERIHVYRYLPAHRTFA